MKFITPPRLSIGDEIRIIAPSDSLVRVGGMMANISSKKKLESWGYKVSFGDHVLENDIRDSSSIKSRVEDIHAAFADKNVKAIVSVIGGATSNELLPYLDFNLIKENPKIIVGFSDFTALANAITSKTGLITYYGPAYATLKMNGELGKYQDTYWQKVLKNEHVTLTSSQYWESYNWFDPDASPNLKSNAWKVYTPGIAEGVTVGGNLNTFYLLQGTPFQPNLDGNILLTEFSDGSDWYEYSRNLASLLQIANNPKGLLIGRFPPDTGMTEEKLLYVLELFPILKKIPVIYNVNFGHTQPIFTIPIGKKVTIDSTKKTISY
ncbi:S66 peptidase family protein [Lentilactobacillus sp. Marseille-Q4993]|uniref:S66 family peptidase n=1 Tax=Lentilactobacillus sp. Marseille-Q4993 TaxID=3039492 RepID=UPI0024BC5D57|nr:S66 peptidase family protein [Lentilactobacillus sp. Marseille-Q4993]